MNLFSIFGELKVNVPAFFIINRENKNDNIINVMFLAKNNSFFPITNILILL